MADPTLALDKLRMYAKIVRQLMFEGGSRPLFPTPLIQVFQCKMTVLE
jgi:hypothetical protein